jgi:hypothetical protein
MRKTMTYSPPIAIIIPNYNMPEATDALGDFIKTNIKYPHKLIVVDNGSDIMNESVFTQIRVEENLQTTAGFLLGLNYADHLERKYGEKFFAYWFLITSTSLPESTTGDILAPLVRYLKEDTQAVGISHALTYESTTHWTHLIDRNTQAPRRTWMLDNISTLYRADWFNEIGRFDPRLYMAWGIDLETSYIARSQERSLWVYDGLRVRKTTDVAYDMGRMNQTAQQRRIIASENMDNVLRTKYGNNWDQIMRGMYVDKDWR